MAAHEDDRPPRRLGGPHHVLDPWIADDRVAHEERLDRSRVDGLCDFRWAVRARPIRRDRFEEPLDEPRLVADPALPEHLCADAGLQRLVDPVHPRVGCAVAVDLRRKRGVTGLEILQERFPREPRPHDDEGFADCGHPELREDVIEKGGAGVPRGKHLPMARRANRRELVHAVLPELGDEGFLVVEGEECDERLLRRRDGLIDPPKFVRLPRLQDREDILHRDVQRVVASEVLRSLDDDAGDAQAVRESLELDPFDADRQRDADFLSPFGSDLVRLHLFPAVGRCADQVPGEDEVMEMPQVVRVLHTDLDLPRLRVAVKDSHRAAGHGGSSYLSISTGPAERVPQSAVNMLTEAAPRRGVSPWPSSNTFSHP